MILDELLLHESEMRRIRRKDHSSPGDGSLSPIWKWKITNSNGQFLMKQYRDTTAMPLHLKEMAGLSEEIPSQKLLTKDFFEYEGFPALIFTYINGNHPELLTPELSGFIGQSISIFHKKSGLIHGDTHRGNIVIGTSKKPWLIDIDKVSRGDKHYDIALLVFYELAFQESNKPAMQREGFSAFLEAYNDKVILDDVKRYIRDIIKESETVSAEELGQNLISNEKFNSRKHLYTRINDNIKGSLLMAFNP